MDCSLTNEECKTPSMCAPFGGCKPSGYSDLCATLDRLHAAIDRCDDERRQMRDQYYEAQATISRLTAELEGMRKALEPFAELAGEGNDDQPDDTVIVVTAGRSIYYDALTLGDARRARRALTPSTPSESAKVGI